MKPLTHGAQQNNMKKNTVYQKQKTGSIPEIETTTLVCFKGGKLPFNHPLPSPHTAPDNKKNLLLDCTDYINNL